MFSYVKERVPRTRSIERQLVALPDLLAAVLKGQDLQQFADNVRLA